MRRIKNQFAGDNKYTERELFEKHDELLKLRVRDMLAKLHCPICKIMFDDLESEMLWYHMKSFHLKALKL